jgi:hypothetical protein
LLLWEEIIELLFLIVVMLAGKKNEQNSSNEANCVGYEKWRVCIETNLLIQDGRHKE